MNAKSVNIQRNVWGFALSKDTDEEIDMSFEFIKKLPTPAEVREQYPISEAVAAIKKTRDEEIRKVIT